MLKSAILKAQAAEMPDPILEQAFELIRPLYGHTPDGVGGIDQAPVLHEHRDALFGTNERRRSRRGSAKPKALH